MIGAVVLAATVGAARAEGCAGYPAEVRISFDGEEFHTIGVDPATDRAVWCRGGAPWAANLVRHGDGSVEFDIRFRNGVFPRRLHPVGGMLVSTQRGQIVQADPSGFQ